jgi:hypothetical protein
VADQPVGPVSTIERISPTVLPARPSCARLRPQWLLNTYGLGGDSGGTVIIGADGQARLVLADRTLAFSFGGWTQLVREKNLPPKILVVHRFRADMVPDAENIRPTPRVQVVIHMDGWGLQHPVAFTGFKFFYHNDTKSGEPMLTGHEVLQLLPQPLYLQYQ